MSKDNEFLVAAIERMIRLKAEEILASVLQETQDQVAKALANSVDAVVLDVAKHYEIESMQDQLVIRVMKEVGA